MKLNEYDVSHPYTATLIASERITPPHSEAEVRHLVLQLPVPDFDYVEGQSIGVIVPGPHQFGNPYHLRLYSIASPRLGENGNENSISICVRRCFYVDEVNGEKYPGVASNFLCDAKKGSNIQITGPYGAHFSVPPDETSNLLMVGVGTGIAPFRAFVRHIYEERGGWKGRVRLFYGARAGVELLYLNEQNKDLALYYDEKSFRAFQALSPRPVFDEPPALDRLLIDNAREIWGMIQDRKTYVYIAGLTGADEKFEKAMIIMAGSKDSWFSKKQELVKDGRYSELLYD